MSSSKKILILGHGGHGKDTACELLATELKLTSTSSSRFAFDRFIWGIVKHEYSCRNEAYADRRRRRKEWYQMIAAWNDPLDRMTRAILYQFDIYNGMRSNAEYQASKHHFDRILWIDRSKIAEPESKDSFDIEFNPDEMIRIDNNHDVYFLLCNLKIALSDASHRFF